MAILQTGAKKKEKRSGSNEDYDELQQNWADSLHCWRRDKVRVFGSGWKAGATPSQSERESGEEGEK